MRGAAAHVRIGSLAPRDATTATLESASRRWRSTDDFLPRRWRDPGWVTIPPPPSRRASPVQLQVGQLDRQERVSPSPPPKIFSNSGDEHAREEGRRHEDHEGLSPLTRASVKVKPVASSEGDEDRTTPRVGEGDLVGHVRLAGANLGELGAERGSGVDEAAVRGEQREARLGHAHLLQEIRVVPRPRRSCLPGRAIKSPTRRGQSRSRRADKGRASTIAMGIRHRVPNN